jgi:hypothetical protein
VQGAQPDVADAVRQRGRWQAFGAGKLENLARSGNAGAIRGDLQMPIAVSVAQTRRIPADHNELPVIRLKPGGNGAAQASGGSGYECDFFHVGFYLLSFSD